MYNLPPQVNTALQMLNLRGFEAWVVGGAVRDLLRGTEIHDWDITTSALPEQTQAVFGGFRLIHTGLKHGTVTVIIDELPLEITTYRLESDYSDHRRPDRVVFTSNLEEDLARRDFTVNAMAWHPEKGLVDPFGGQTDLERKLIRCVGQPERRFQEDALRMLRGLRFASVLGFSIEPATAAAIHRNRNLLTHVAGERIRTELTGLLMGNYPDTVLGQYHDVLAVPIPEIQPMVNCPQHIKYHCYDVWGHTAAVTAAMPADPILRWAGFFHDFGKPSSLTWDDRGITHFRGHPAVSAELADGIMRRLRFDNASRTAVLSLVSNHHTELSPTEKDAKRMIQRFGTEGAKALIQMFRADTLGKAPVCLPRLEDCARLERLIGQITPLAPGDLAVRGGDLMELGLHGSALGDALERLVDAVLFENIPNQKADLLRYAREKIIK